MKKWQKRSVTLFKVLFILWQVAGLLFLLNNFELVENVYYETQQATRDFLSK
tara:strand:+ start:1141 stop:1296 length:156 start_codon:yes stop_codon:yes gene_type:complete